MGCHFFLQGIFQTQGLNPSLLIRQVDSLPPGRPWVYIYKRGRLRPAHLSVARRSSPTPEVRGRAGRTPCLTGGSQEELPHVRGHGQRPRVPGCDGTGTAKRSYPTSEVRGDGLEELPWVRGPSADGRSCPPPPCPRPGVAAGRPSPRPRSGGCVGAGGPGVEGQEGRQ